MKAILIYATVVGVFGAVVSYSIANRIASGSKSLERSTVK